MCKKAHSQVFRVQGTGILQQDAQEQAGSHATACSCASCSRRATGATRGFTRFGSLDNSPFSRYTWSVIDISSFILTFYHFVARKGRLTIRMRTRHAPTRDRRVDILAAARQVLAEKGLEATTISEIVSRAQVAHGTFYTYFSSKFAVVYALAEQMLERVLEAVREAVMQATSFSETLELGLRATFRQMGEYADVYPILNNGGGLVENPANWERLFEPYYHLLATLIKRWQAVGQIDTAVHPDISARLITSFVDRACED